MIDPVHPNEASGNERAVNMRNSFLYFCICFFTPQVIVHTSYTLSPLHRGIRRNF